MLSSFKLWADPIIWKLDILSLANLKLKLWAEIYKPSALSIEANSVHGSDSIENAKKEISFFFSETEIFED